MNITKAEKQVEKRQADLNKLKDELASLQETIEGLRAERNTAVKELVTDPSKAKVISALDGKMKEPCLRAEGLQTLVNEAEGELEKAQTALKEAEEETKARLAQSIGQAEEAFWDNYTRSLPEKGKRISDLYCQLCSLIADIQIDGIRINSDGTAQRSGEMENFFYKLQDINGQELESRGCKRLPWAGWPGTILILPLISPDTEGFIDRWPIDAGMIAKERKEKRIATVQAEFQRKENSR